MQCPFLLWLCQEVLLRVFRWLFFFRCLFERKRKVDAECVSPPHKWDKRSHTAWQTGKNDCCRPAEQVPSDRKHSYFLVWVYPFHASADFLFFWLFPLFTDFPLKFILTQSASVFVYLHPAPFSRIASGCHFRSGRKGNSGIWRESKVKPPVFCGNLQPFG